MIARVAGGLGRWGRLDRMWVLAALLIGAETSLIHLLSAVLGGSPDAAPLGWPLLWAVGLAAFLLPRLLERAPSLAYVAALGGAVLAALLLSIKVSAFPDRSLWDAGWIWDAARAFAFVPSGARHSVYFLVVVLLAVWAWEGRRETPRLDTAGKLFRLGPIPVTVLLLGGLARWGALGPELGVLVRSLVTFFLLCLLALAYSQWVETTLHSSNRAGATAGWASASLLPLLLVIGGTVLASALLFGRSVSFLEVLGTVLGYAVLIAALVVRAVGLIVAYLLLPAVFVVDWIRERLEGLRGEGGPRRSRPDSGGGGLLDRLRRGEWDAPPLLSWVLLALGVALALYLITRYRPRRRRPDARSVVRESIWEPPDVLGGLDALLKRLRGRFAREHDPLRALLADPRWKHTARVRLAYRDVQRLYERAGSGRPPSDTAHEHARTQDSRPLDELTDLYEQARYGTLPASESLADRAERVRTDVEADVGRGAGGGSSGGGGEGW